MEDETLLQLGLPLAIVADKVRPPNSASGPSEARLRRGQRGQAWGPWVVSTAKVGAVLIMGLIS